MAFLVCYAQDGVADWRDKAIYLDRTFYDLVHAYAKTPECSGITARIAMLQYGDEIVLQRAQLEDVVRELSGLQGENLALRRHSSRFQEVIRAALDVGLELGVSGDMYPEL